MSDEYEYEEPGIWWSSLVIFPKKKSSSNKELLRCEELFNSATVPRENSAEKNVKLQQASLPFFTSHFRENLLCRDPRRWKRLNCKNSKHLSRDIIRRKASLD